MLRYTIKLGTREKEVSEYAYEARYKGLGWQIIAQKGKPSLARTNSAAAPAIPAQVVEHVRPEAAAPVGANEWADRVSAEGDPEAVRVLPVVTEGAPVDTITATLPNGHTGTFERTNVPGEGEVYVKKTEALDPAGDPVQPEAPKKRGRKPKAQ